MVLGEVIIHFIEDYRKKRNTVPVSAKAYFIKILAVEVDLRGVVG